MFEGFSSSPRRITNREISKTRNSKPPRFKFQGNTKIQSPTDTPNIMWAVLVLEFGTCSGFEASLELGVWCFASYRAPDNALARGRPQS